MILSKLTQNLAPYSVRKIAPDDHKALVRLHQGNTAYNACALDGPLTEHGILGGLTALPPGTNAEQKFYIGLFDDGTLIACLDYIERYPDTDTVFLGLLMLDVNVKRRGLGTKILRALLLSAKESGYRKIRLGCYENNTEGCPFWTKHGFIKVAEKTINNRRLLVMERGLVP